MRCRTVLRTLPHNLQSKYQRGGHRAPGQPTKTLTSRFRSPSAYSTACRWRPLWTGLPTHALSLPDSRRIRAFATPGPFVLNLRGCLWCRTAVATSVSTAGVRADVHKGWDCEDALSVLLWSKGREKPMLPSQVFAGWRLALALFCLATIRRLDIGKALW